MIKVGLYGVEFFARHGFYPEEQLLGNHFLLDIEVDYVPGGTAGNDQLSNAVDYEKLYAIAAEEMAQPKKLLETVVNAIVTRIRAQYPKVKTIKVVLKKLNPPVKGKVAYSAVTLVDAGEEK